MKIATLRLLLFLFASGATAGCAGGGGAATTPASADSHRLGSRVTAQDIASQPAGSYWSGTVSGINPNGITANCGQSNFAQQFGCLPVITTGATIAGTPVIGQYFQLWADLSQLAGTATITPTVINYASTPFPVTATAVAPAAPDATAAPVTFVAPQSTLGTFMGFTNASDPDPAFAPYSPSSVWRTRISANPRIASYSDAVVAAQFPNGRASAVVRATEAGVYDYNHPRFYAKPTDALVRVACTQYCGSPDNGGVPAQIRIPFNARPAGGGDSHFDIIQPDGTEITMWAAVRPSGNWYDGATVAAASVANCGSYANGEGWMRNGPGPTAAGYCNDAGIVTASELAAGRIAHALFITGECAIGLQYPVQGYATTDRCTSGVGPPLGGREWYDVPCSTTQANGALRPWEKAILCALNEYGGYLGDDVQGGAYFTGGLTPLLESEEAWYDASGPNYTSPFAALASQGWASIVIPNARAGSSGRRWVGADPWQPAGVDFRNHIHWLDECSARASC